MAWKSPESLSDDSPDFRTSIPQEMRRQGIEESIRDLVHTSYETALNDIGSLWVLSRAERGRLRRLVQNDLLAEMIVKD
jgi:hypothetical protein